MSTSGGFEDESFGSSSKKEIKKNSKKTLKVTSKSLKISCKICGDLASGFHYGVHACEGCKGFFRRTLRLNLRYSHCKLNCKIDIRSRNKCQFCRFQKCTSLGMSHNAIRFGRMPQHEKEKYLHESLNNENIGLSSDERRIQDITNTIFTAYQSSSLNTRSELVEMWNKSKNEPGKQKILHTYHDIIKVYPELASRLQGYPSTHASSSVSEASSNATFTNCDSLLKSAVLYEHNPFDIEDISSKIRNNEDKNNHQLLHCYLPPKDKSTDYLKEKSRRNSGSSADIKLEEASEDVTSEKEHYTNFSNAYNIKSRDVFNAIDGNEVKLTAKENFNLLGVEVFKYMYNKMQQEVVNAISGLVHFAKSIPAFTNLGIKDKVTLLKYGSYEALFVLFSLIIFDEGIYFPIFGIHVTKFFIQSLGFGKMAENKMDFAESILKLNLTDQEMALFVASIIFSSDRHGLDKPKLVEDYQEELLIALQSQLAISHRRSRWIFPHLLLKISSLREVVAQHLKLVNNLSEVRSSFPPLLDEILRGLN